MSEIWKSCCCKNVHKKEKRKSPSVEISSSKLFSGMISLINNLDCLSSSAGVCRLISAVGTSAETSGAALGAGSMILKEYFLTELSGVSTCLASYGEGAGLYTGAVRRWTMTKICRYSRYF